MAPSDRDRFDNEPDAPVRGFEPMLAHPFPFPSMLVASRDDHRVSFERTTFFAQGWGSQLVNAGALGHLDTE